MYRITSGIIGCIVLASQIGLAQVWTRSYGGSGFEYGYNIHPLSDGGFLIAGAKTFADQPNITKYWAARFDASGNIRWDSVYGPADLSLTLFGSAKTRAEGMMLGGFTGKQGSGAESALMYRIDSTGAVEWSFTKDYSSSDHFHFFVERNEGGYYFGGHTDSKGDARGDMWLLRLDSSRNVIWEKEYDNSSGEHAHWGIGTHDGGVFLLGHTSVGGYEKFWGVKVDSTGTVLWKKVYGSVPNVHDSPYHVFETREGNYAMIGGSQTASQTPTGTSWLLVIDTLGNVLVDQHYGNPLYSTFTWSGTQTSDSGYILSGYTTYNTNGREDMYVVKTDRYGVVEWEKTVGGAGTDYGYDVTETTGGYIAAGYTGSGSLMTGGGGDLLVVKFAKSMPQLPMVTTLALPVDGSLDLPPDPQLTWQVVAGAKKYQLQVYSDAGILMDDSNLVEASRAITGLQSGKQYWWRVRAGNEVGWGPFSVTWSFTTRSVSGVEDEIVATSQYDLLRNVPNPFSTTTMLQFVLPQQGRVRLDILDALGTKVMNVFDGELEKGDHRLMVDGHDLPSGQYLVRMIAFGMTRTIGVTVVR